MKKFFANLIVLPVRLLAEIGDFLPVFNTAGLWKLIWKVTKDSEDCCLLLLHLCKNIVPDEARKIAEETIAKNKDSTPGALMGMLETQINKDLESGKRWIRITEENNCRNPEMLLFLKLLISVREGQENESIMDEIIARNDLPVNYSQVALFSKAWKLAERRQWEKAEEIADKILQIEEQVDARFIKWMCCMVKGNQSDANTHLEEAKKLSDNSFHLFTAQGWLNMDNQQEAMKSLYQAQKSGVMLKESRSPLGSLFYSQRYREFCEGQAS